LTKRQFERRTETKSLVKPTWNGKMTVLSTFLESSLNFLSSDTKKSGTVSEKNGVKVLTVRKTC